MRLKPSYVVILAFIVLILVIGAVVLQDRKLNRAQADRATAATTERPQTVEPKVSGRERCKQKCSAIHKGYIYKAPQGSETERSSHAASELCDCI
jgi:hypothetical protein